MRPGIFFVLYNILMTMREDVVEYVGKKYGTKPETPWMKYPKYVVLRHSDNRKWYAIMMNIAREKLQIGGEGEVDIIDIKCDPDLIDTLKTEKGFLPAYHMNKRNWLTILLDGSAEKEQIFALLDMSYSMTNSKKKEI